jgi:excisionase family DNA binding protein
MKKKPRLRKVRPAHPNAVLLSIQQAALVMGVSESTLRRAVDKGTLPSVMVRSENKNRLIRVSRQALQAFIDREEKRTSR